MEPLLSYCGMRCDLCLAFQPNLTKTPENRQILSDGWHRYFGFRIPPEEIQCPGCRTNANTTLDEGCPVRPCVKAKNLENCAQCQDMVCEKLQERLVDFEQMQIEYGQPIPPEDRKRFIFPYENRNRLDKLQKKPSPTTNLRNQ